MPGKRVSRLAWITSMIVLIGCDPNPNGPSAPTVPPAEPGKGQDPTSQPAKTVPLKRVGAPIGMVVPPIR